MPNQDPYDFTDRYNTKLSPKEEAQFQKEMSNRLGDLYDYDLRGAWKELKSGTMTEDKKGHLGDKYKKPNHSTFSNQSQYHGQDGFYGGVWYKGEDGKDYFRAGATNLRSPEGLANYMAKYEPNVILEDGRVPQRQQVLTPEQQQGLAALGAELALQADADKHGGLTTYNPSITDSIRNYAHNTPREEMFMDGLVSVGSAVIPALANAKVLSSGIKVVPNLASSTASAIGRGLVREGVEQSAINAIENEAVRQNINNLAQTEDGIRILQGLAKLR